MSDGGPGDHELTYQERRHPVAGARLQESARIVPSEPPTCQCARSCGATAETTLGHCCVLVRRYDVLEVRGRPSAEFSLREGVECFLDESAGFVGRSRRWLG